MAFDKYPDMLRTVAVTPLTYQFVEVLGQGATGCVYKAIRTDCQRHIAQPVALKILNSRNSVEQWRDEFASLARVHSDHCVRVFGFEWIDGEPALVLEFIDGLCLSEILQFGGLSAAENAEILRQISSGLTDLHRAGLCHGDLSPNNVMIDSSGKVKLLDFGLGNVVEGRRRVTVEFADPEVLAGAAPSGKSDEFSLARLKDYLESRGGAACEPLGVAVGDALSGRVRRAQAGRRRLRRKTQSLILGPAAEPRRRLAGHGWTIAKACFVSLAVFICAGSQGRFFENRLAASVTVRSQKWVWIEWDGKKVGYAPLDVAYISPGLHHLRWKSAHQEGDLALTLNPGDHIVLDDQDLTRR